MKGAQVQAAGAQRGLSWTVGKESVQPPHQELSFFLSQAWGSRSARRQGECLLAQLSYNSTCCWASLGTTLCFSRIHHAVTFHPLLLCMDQSYVAVFSQPHLIHHKPAF